MSIGAMLIRFFVGAWFTVVDHLWVWFAELRMEAKSSAVMGIFCWIGEAWYHGQEAGGVRGVRAVTRIAARRAALVMLSRARAERDGSPGMFGADGLDEVGGWDD